MFFSTDLNPVSKYVNYSVDLCETTFACLLPAHWRSLSQKEPIL
jgi:hypothetical protein